MPPLPPALVIIGGGVAGRAAATEAARYRLPTVLIDERPTQRSDGLPESIRLEAGVAVASVSVGREVLWTTDRSSGTFVAPHLILATGGTPRPVPFPGWTLPGIVAFGPRGLSESDIPGPSRRAIVAGTGRPLLDAARWLMAHSVEVVSVLDAARPPWERDRDSPVAATSGAQIAPWDLERLPVQFGRTVFAAIGRDRLEAVRHGPVRPDDWAPRKEEGETVEADLLAIGFGQIANNELSVLVGCAQTFDEAKASWLPVRDRLMRTSVPGIFSVGDGAGIAGNLGAEEEGRIAAITVAEDEGIIGPREADDRRAAMLEGLASLSAIRSILDEAARPRPGLLDLLEPDTIVCPCEGVTEGDLTAGLTAGARDLTSLKLWTRLGMGSCQGRRCGSSGAAWLCRATGLGPQAIGRINPRPPARPVTLAALAAMREGMSAPGEWPGGGSA